MKQAAAKVILTAVTTTAAMQTVASPAEVWLWYTLPARALTIFSVPPRVSAAEQFSVSFTSLLQAVRGEYEYE